MLDIESGAVVLKAFVFELVIPSRINYYADLYTKGGHHRPMRRPDINRNNRLHAVSCNSNRASFVDNLWYIVKPCRLSVLTDWQVNFQPWHFFVHQKIIHQLVVWLGENRSVVRYFKFRIIIINRSVVLHSKRDDHRRSTNTIGHENIWYSTWNKRS